MYVFKNETRNIPLIIPMKKFIALLFVVLVLFGCTTAPVPVARDPGLQIQSKGIRVVFVDQPFMPSKNALSNDRAIDRERLKFADAVVERIPEKLKEYNLPSIGKVMTEKEIRTLKEIDAYFPDSPADWHVLLVLPFRIAKSCLGCAYVFSVNLSLIDPNTGEVVWRKTLEQPLVNFTSWGPRGALNNFSYKMADALAADLQLDSKAHQLDKVTK